MILSRELDEKPCIAVFVDKSIDGYEIVEKILFRDRFAIQILCGVENQTNNPCFRSSTDLIIVCKDICRELYKQLKVFPRDILFILEDKNAWQEACTKYSINKVYDTIIKPFDCNELTRKIDGLLGIKSVLRDSNSIICYKDYLKLDCSKNRLFVNGILVDLTEFEMLLSQMLTENCEEYIQCKYVNFWLKSRGIDLAVSPNHLRTTVCRLKSKLLKKTGCELIKSRYGKGYQLTI